MQKIEVNKINGQRLEIGNPEHIAYLKAHNKLTTMSIRISKELNRAINKEADLHPRGKIRMIQEILNDSLSRSIPDIPKGWSQKEEILYQIQLHEHAKESLKTTKGKIPMQIYMAHLLDFYFLSDKENQSKIA